MSRYVAFLRGVSPLNAKMPELRRCFEQAGFRNVNTVLGSGNVVFDSPRAATPAALKRKAQDAMTEHLGRSFFTIVRPQEELIALLEADPFAAFRLPKDAKRIVTFLREPHEGKLKLPVELDKARILAVQGAEVLTAYVPQPGNPAFMHLIEKMFGKDVTTRTWETVKKCAAA
ncbi:MAG: DUF1697 domain-containing protein [Ramlibacter sp.]